MLVLVVDCVMMQGLGNFWVCACDDARFVLVELWWWSTVHDDGGQLCL